MQDEENDSDHDEQVNQTTGDMENEEPGQPGDKQNDGKYEQHLKSSRASLCILCTYVAMDGETDL